MAAQVIPVFLLAMIFETRLLSDPPSTIDDDFQDPDDPDNWIWFEPVLRFWGILVIASAEIMALLAVDRGEASDTTNALVWFGMGVCVYGVLQPLAEQQWRYWHAAVRTGRTQVKVWSSLAAWVIFSVVTALVIWYLRFALDLLARWL